MSLMPCSPPEMIWELAGYWGGCVSRKKGWWRGEGSGVEYLDGIALDACELEGCVADYGVANDDAVFWVARLACSAGF